MTTDLLILHCDDTEHLCVLVKLNLHDSIAVKVITIDKTQFPLRPSRVLELTKCHSCLVLLSPSFLNFLERRPEQFFSVFRILNPAKTIAIFCCGLQEKQVLFHHKSPLISYDNWSKFVIPDHAEEFPVALMNRLHSLSEGWGKDGGGGGGAITKSLKVNVVPNEVSVDHNHVYIIFSEHLDDLKKIQLNLCNDSTISVSTEEINPFVIRFVLPDYLIESRELIPITVCYEDKELANVKLKCRESDDESYSLQKISNLTKPFVTNLGESMLQLQMHLMDDTPNDSQDVTLQEGEMSSLIGTENAKEVEDLDFREDLEDTTQSLLELCAKYGLEELKFTFLSDSTLQKTKPDVNTDQTVLETTDKKLVGFDDALTKKENSSELESLDEGIKCSTDSLSENPDRRTLTASSFLRRSISLPSTFMPSADLESPGHHGYLDMAGAFGWITEDTKPHEILLKNAVSCEELMEDTHYVSDSLSNHIYMSMKFPEEEGFQKTCLSDSQQELLELMHHFKRGIKTISQVEQHFQEWHLKHETTVADQKLKLRELRNTYGKAQKGQTLRLPGLKKIILRKPKKKDKSQGHDTDKSKSKQKQEKQEKQEKQLKRASKASDTSISSGCSANSNASEASHSKLDLSVENKMMNSFYVGFSPTNSFCYPKFQECQIPPPPPFKPPPTPTSEGHDPSYPQTKLPRRKPVPLPRRTTLRRAPPSPDYIVPVDHVEYANTGPNRKSIKAQNTPKSGISKATIKLTEPTPSRLLTMDDRRRKGSAPEARIVRPLVTSPSRVPDTSTAVELKHRRNPHPTMFYVTRRSSSDPQMRIFKKEPQPTYLELCRDSSGS